MLTSFVFKCWLSSTTPYLNDWDERFHALVAKNMAESGEVLRPVLYRTPVLEFGADDWARSHVWLHKPPLTAWIMALSIKLLGVNVFAVRLPSILLASLAVVLTYTLGYKLFDRRVGLVAAALFSIHGLTNLLVTGKVPTDHVDVYFMFFVLLACLPIFYKPDDRWPRYTLEVLSGICLGFAVLVKWLPAYTVLLVYFGYRYRLVGMRDLIVGAGIIVLVSVAIWLPWQVYAAATYPEIYRAEQLHRWLHVTQYLDGHYNGPLYFLRKSVYVYGEIWLAAIVLSVHRLRNGYNRRLISLLIWILIPTIFFSLVATKMQGYTYFTAPAVFLLSAYFLVWLYRRNRSSKILRYTLIGLLLVSPVVRFYESFQFGDIATRSPRKHTDIDPARDNPSTVIFGSDSPYNDMFFLDVGASYNIKPVGADLKKLEKELTIILVEGN